MKRRGSSSIKTSSLRWRLTFVSLAMLALALFALDTAIYIGQHQTAYSDLKANIQGVIAKARDVTPSPSLQATANTISRTNAGTNVVAIIYQPGQYPVIGKPSGFDAPRLPAIDRSSRVPDFAWTEFLTAVNSDSSLSEGWLNTYPSSSATTLFIASNTPVEKSLRRLLVAELIGTLLVLGLAIIIVGVVVRLSLRPLDRMAATAGAITAGDIEKRLRPSQPWTELGKLATAIDAMLDSLAKSLTSERSAREHANRSEQRMRDFLSDASHELRTPIAGLQWSAETLLNHQHTREERERLSFQIAKQAHRASKLIADLLSIARLDQGVQLDYGQFDLTALAAEEVERVQECEPGVELRLKSEGGCPISADGERVRRVISNLIDNSCKAVEHRGEIEVIVRRFRRTAELEVRDSGPGVPVAERKRIFERFVRLDEARARSDASGSGLGLAISLGIAEAHGGKLVCAKSDSGARFVLTLPLNTRAVPADPERARAGAV